MDFSPFPFDQLTCSMTYESFNYNTDEVKMKWSSIGAAPMKEKMQIVDYELVSIETSREEVVSFLTIVIAFCLTLALIKKG